MTNEGTLVYLDVCALNRPFDDQSQLRIRLETDAVLLILGHARSGNLTLSVSPAHHVEVSANPDVTRREHVQLLLLQLGAEISAELSITRKRAVELTELGMGVADAAHVAFAEAASCDFVTVDERLLRQCTKVGIGIWCGTPMAFCEKENLR